MSNEASFTFGGCVSYMLVHSYQYSSRSYDEIDLEHTAIAFELHLGYDKSKLVTAAKEKISQLKL